MTARARPSQSLLGSSAEQMPCLSSAKPLGGSRLPLETIGEKVERPSPAYGAPPDPLVTPPEESGTIPLQIRDDRIYEPYGKQVGIENVSRTYLSQDGLFQLTLASGGVPRDYLNIFVEAVQIARELGHTKWLTPTTVYKGAYRIMRRTKLVNLREDVGADAARLERVYQRLLNFCLREKRKTAFLISEEEATMAVAEHELVQQLMDFKLIHVVEPDTSAASGRPGRYEAYALDFAFFMEPRRRGIEIVKFWEKDENRRRRGLREAPVFELAWLSGLEEVPLEAPTEDVLAEIDAETGEPETTPVAEDAPDDRV
jgi:hypothetical protein